jgi:hypothetical protein
MTTSLQTLRTTRVRGIEQNPVTVTIQRTEKLQQDGAWKKVDSTVGPLTVRIYSAGRGRRSVQSVDVPAVRQVDEAWGLHADWQADLRAGPNVTDEFDAPGHGRFRIKTVRPDTTSGQVYGYTAVLEKVQ